MCVISLLFLPMLFPLVDDTRVLLNSKSDYINANYIAVSVPVISKGFRENWTMHDYFIYIAA